jgi:hypothetical protein
MKGQIYREVRGLISEGGNLQGGEGCDLKRGKFTGRRGL